MRVAILVGWHYVVDSIPAWMDLLRMISWTSSHSLHTIVVTDQPQRLQHIISPLITTIPCTGKKELMRILYKSRANEFLFYYSGHGIDDGMLMPSNEDLSWKTIHRILCPSGKIVDATYIIDCCYSPTFDLPYTYREGWKGISEEKPHSKIVLFIPSVERANVSTSGSSHTLCIVDLLRQRKGYDEMHSAGIVIRSNMPHAPYYHPTIRFHYQGDKLLVSCSPTACSSAT